MKRYIFEFHGELRPSARPEEVAEALARMFQVDLEDTLPLVDGRASFRREGLNRFTAGAYQQRFAKIGALGEVMEEPRKIEPDNGGSSDPESIGRVATESLAAEKPAGQIPSCPKCHSTNINHAKCLACGIYFEKYYRTMREIEPTGIGVGVDKVTPGSGSKIRSPGVADPDEDQVKATKWMSIAGLFLSIVFVADGYLHNVHALPGAGIDFGYWPFVVGHLVLLRSCFLCARAKGYSGFAGLLGLLSLAGLSILILLPDRRLQRSGVSFRSLAGAVFCILISVDWLAAFAGKQEAMDQIARDASRLSAGRHEYPSAELDESLELFESEQKEMQDFLERSLATIQEHNFRPNEISEMADHIFAGLARYAVWRNYQTYLHVENKQPIPVALEDGWIARDRRLFAEILEFQIDRQSQPRLYEEKNNWMNGNNPELTSPFWYKFSQQHLWRVFDQFQTAHRQAVRQRSQRQSASEPSAAIDINLKDLSLPGFGKTKTRLTKNTVTYSASLGPLSKAPLTLAFYLKPYQRPSGNPYQRSVRNKGFLPHVAVISPDFPQKYLYGYFNVLQNYSVAYLR